MKLNTHNSMRPGTASFDRPLPDMSVLGAQSYVLVPIQRLRVLNSDPWVKFSDHPLVRTLEMESEIGAVISGAETRLVHGKHPLPSEGPILRNGHLDTEGLGRANFRGAVGVLEDGTVIMARTDGAGEKDLKKHFGQKGNDLVALLGGGGLLIENGVYTTNEDVVLNQLYGGAGTRGGLHSRSMVQNIHVVMGIREGKAYGALARAKSAFDIRNDFQQAGFGTVIKFAFGSGVVFDNGDTRIHGRNAAGFGIVVAR